MFFLVYLGRFSRDDNTVSWPSSCSCRTLLKVGPGAVSADDISFWAVRVLVLGQPVGFFSIPNPRFAPPPPPPTTTTTTTPPTAAATTTTTTPATSAFPFNLVARLMSASGMEMQAATQESTQEASQEATQEASHEATQVIWQNAQIRGVTFDMFSGASCCCPR